MRLLRSRSRTSGSHCLRFALSLVLGAGVAPSVHAIDGIWVDLNPNTPMRFTSVSLKDVDFISASTGIVVGANGTILLTGDRGDTWVGANSGTSTDLNGVHFIDATKVSVVGAGGMILRSGDGGVTWFSQSGGTDETLLDVHFTDGLTGTAVGSGGTILGTTDGGTIWTPQTSGTDTYLNAVYFVNAQRGVVVGDNGTILSTTNGGESWLPYTGGRECRDHHGVTLCNSFIDVHFVDASIGFLAGYPADPPYLAGGSFLKTSTGGSSWVKQSPPPSDLEIFAAISFADDTDGMLITGQSRLAIAYCTDDAGENWAATSLPLLPGAINALSHGDPLTAFAVGDNGTIARWERGSTPVEQRSWGSVKSLFRE